jgi:tagatose-1,6-bisphosphate aldolase
MTNYKLGKLIHLKKLCTENNHFQMLAVDQRPPIFNHHISSNRKRAYILTSS